MDVGFYVSVALVQRRMAMAQYGTTRSWFRAARTGALFLTTLIGLCASASGCKKDPPKQGFVVVFVQPTNAPDISYVGVRSPGVEIIRRTEADNPSTEERIQVFDREVHLAIPTRGGVIPQVLTVLQFPAIVGWTHFRLS